MKLFFLLITHLLLLFPFTVKSKTYIVKTKSAKSRFDYNGAVVSPGENVKIKEGEQDIDWDFEEAKHNYREYLKAINRTSQKWKNRSGNNCGVPPKCRGKKDLFHNIRLFKFCSPYFKACKHKLTNRK